jgi:hypothetical protein
MEFRKATFRALQFRNVAFLNFGREAYAPQPACSPPTRSATIFSK